MLPITTRIQQAVQQWQDEHEGEIPDTLILGMHETYLLDKEENIFVIRFMGMRVEMAGVYKELRVRRIL